MKYFLLNRLHRLGYSHCELKILDVADIPGSKDKYLALFNQWETHDPIDIKVDFDLLGLDDGAYNVRDLWANKDLGTFNASGNWGSFPA